MRLRTTDFRKPVPRGAGVMLLAGLFASCAVGQPAGLPTAPAATTMPAQHAAVQTPRAWPGAGVFSLPAPSALLPGARQPGAAAARHASYVEADVRKDGNAYGALLPNNRVVADGLNASFTPQWTSSSASAPAGLAYCVYPFLVPGYDRNPQVRLAWGIPPADFHDAWIGLANWNKDRWDWYRDSAAGQLNLASLAPYFDFGGNLLLAVLRTGTDMSSLSEVRLGGLAPTASFSATPQNGMAPLLVNFDAAASSAGEGALVKYEWDYDGDGNYDADTGAVGLASHTYNTDGAWPATLRVTNALGLTATATVPVQVGPWLHTLGRNADDAFYAVATGPAGEIYAVGFTHESRVTIDADLLLLTKWSPAGALVWAKAWDSGHPGAYGYDLGVDSDGNVIVVGRVAVSGFDSQALYQKWTPDGALTYSYEFGDSEWQSLNTLALDGNDIYCAGQTNDAGASDVVALAIYPDGTLDWASEYFASDPDSPVDSALRWNAGSGTNAYYVLAQHDGVGVFPLLLHYTLGMTLMEGKQYGDGANKYYAKSLLVSQSALDLSTRIYVAGQVSHGTGDAVFLTYADGDYVISHQSASFRVSATVGGMVFGNTGDIFICGSEPGIEAGSQYGMLWRFSTQSGSLYSAELYDNGALYTHLAYPLWTPAGLLVAGNGANAGGSWTTINPATFTPTASWSDGPGTSALVTITPSWLAGSVKDWSAPVLDTGGGTQDALLALRPLP